MNPARQRIMEKIRNNPILRSHSLWLSLKSEKLRFRIVSHQDAGISQKPGLGRACFRYFGKMRQLTIPAVVAAAPTIEARNSILRIAMFLPPLATLYLVLKMLPETSQSRPCTARCCGLKSFMRLKVGETFDILKGTQGGANVGALNREAGQGKMFGEWNDYGRVLD